MTPYYQEDGITIYHGDARELMSVVSADVIVTDPPYGMNYVSGWSDRAVRGDETIAVRDAVLATWRGRPAIVFGRWSTPRPDGVRAVLVWDKGEWPGMGDLSFPWGPSHEEIYIIGEGFKGTRMGTVLRRDRIGGNGDHPTEKPVSVMSKLIERCPAGTILDPFMGSGTTLRAAKDLGRQAIGIEIEERYAEIAAKRLSQGVLKF
jgi:site-specific DNA-methyltransferase (adenine-specific)